MIWPFRQASQPPEARLWAHLDACGIPFREPLCDWVDQMHLTASVWCEGLDYCVPDAQTPLIAAQDVPVHAQISEYTDFNSHPDYLSCAVQGAGDHRLNYAKAIAQLTKLFGKGVEISASNAVSREWHFGLARLSCTVWPPTTQHGSSNSRHELFPQTIEEASVGIYPAWRPPLVSSDHDTCANAKLLWADPEPRKLTPLSSCNRDWPTQLPNLPQGLAITPENDLLVIRAQGIFDIHLAGQVKSLKLDRLTPAKAGGEAYLSVITTITGRDGLIDLTREIAAIGGDQEGLDATARDLASKLGVPLDTSTIPNA